MSDNLKAFLFAVFGALVIIAATFLIHNHKANAKENDRVALWCAWSDWSAHTPNKCAPDRATCEKNAKKQKNKTDCTNWLG